MIFCALSVADPEGAKEKKKKKAREREREIPVTSCSDYPGLLSELHEIYIQPKYNFYLILFGNIYLFCIYYIIFYFH
jgi:hypothetical protein